MGPLIPLILIMLLFASPAQAHFGLVIPSESMIFNKDHSDCQLNLAFCHPFAGQGMDLQKPAQFFVANGGKRISLLDTLKPSVYMGGQAFTGQCHINKPGVYQFVMTPQPYYEPAEDSFIIHYTKTVVGAFGAEDGWNEPIGLPVEIIPLTRPFGNYSGNSFSGLVLKNGKPLANATVEVENLNNPPAHSAPNPYFETQILHTDQNGVFTFGIPWSGWWGFAALTDAPDKIKKDGKPKNVELGGVIWVSFDSPVIPGK